MVDGVVEDETAVRWSLTVALMRLTGTATSSTALAARSAVRVIPKARKVAISSTLRPEMGARRRRRSAQRCLSSSLDNFFSPLEDATSRRSESSDEDEEQDTVVAVTEQSVSSWLQLEGSVPAAVAAATAARAFLRCRLLLAPRPPPACLSLSVFWDWVMVRFLAPFAPCC